MTMHIKNGDQWPLVRRLHHLEGGAYQRVLRGWIQVDGEWRLFYTDSDWIETTIFARRLPFSTVTERTTNQITFLGHVSWAGQPRVRLPQSGQFVELYLNGDHKMTSYVDRNGYFGFTWEGYPLGFYTPTVRFKGTGNFAPSQITLDEFRLFSKSTVEVNREDRFVVGEEATLTGTIRHDYWARDLAPTGDVQLELLEDTGVRVLDATTLSGGRYALSWVPEPSTVGLQRMRVRYLGTDVTEPSVSDTLTRVVRQPTPAKPVLTVVDQTHTSLTLEITDQAHVNSFRVTCSETGKSVTTPSSRTEGAKLTQLWAVSPNSSLTFNIVAISDNPDIWSTPGDTLYISTGREAQVDKGSGAFTFTAASTGSWRSADGWSSDNRLAQGYPEAADGPYTGVASFDVEAMRAAVDARGAARPGRWENVTCTKFEVNAARERGGTNARAPIGWHLSTTAPGSGGEEPDRSDPTTSSPAGLIPTTSGWMTLSSAEYGEKLLEESPVQSIAMADESTANYARFSGGSSFKIRATYTWDWVSAPAVAPTWRSSGDQLD